MAELPNDLGARLRDDLDDERQPERDDDEDARADDEHEIEQLAAQVGPIGVAAPDRTERRAHRCHHPARRPEEPAECDDTDACTTDTCPAGACTHQSIAGCPAEICDDRIDNDGDGLVDCADPDCVGTTACPLEICGNCIDDDGDGLVDYEDSDCCDNTTSLVIRKMSLRTKPQASKNRLRLKTQYAPKAPTGFDPGLQGTQLQVRDSEGTLLCQKIPFKSDSASTRKGVFKFKDKTGKMASGIRRAKFKIQKKHSNRIMFRTKGKKMSFREPVGSDITVTLAVGNQCTTQNASLRSRKGIKNGRALVFKPVKTK